MKVYNQITVACALAKALHKPILFLSFGDGPWKKKLKVAPYLNSCNFDVSQALMGGYAFITCDSTKELNRLFDLTVGDDGPTKLNKYEGSVRIYALTIDCKGCPQNENI